MLRRLTDRLRNLRRGRKAAPASPRGGVRRRPERHLRGRLREEWR